MNVKPLPHDLEVMEADDLAYQRVVRDERLVSLFRRWPALSRVELRQLRTLHTERLQIARHIGKLRRRRRSAE